VPVTQITPKYDIQLKHNNTPAVNRTLVVKFLAHQCANVATTVAAEI
jgi:hypothetical protein